MLLVGTASLSYAKEPTKITVFSASSLSPLLPQIVAEFERQHNVKIAVVYAGSGQLARQIQYGASADIFVSANTVWSDAVLNDARLTSAYVGNFASNHLVVVGSKRVKGLPNNFDPNDSSWWLDALNGQRLALGEPSSVPVGMYAQQALQWYSVWPQLSIYLAPSNSTRSTLALVERGQTPLGVVYSSDAVNSDAVTIIGRFDEQSHSKIEYPILVLDSKNATQQSRTVISDFSQYLLSDEVQQQIISAGFTS